MKEMNLFDFLRKHAELEDPTVFGFKSWKGQEQGIRVFVDDYYVTLKYLKEPILIKSDSYIFTQSRVDELGDVLGGIIPRIVLDNYERKSVQYFVAFEHEICTLMEYRIKYSKLAKALK